MLDPDWSKSYACPLNISPNPGQFTQYILTIVGDLLILTHQGFPVSVPYINLFYLSQTFFQQYFTWLKYSISDS